MDLAKLRAGLLVLPLALASTGTAQADEWWQAWRGSLATHARYVPPLANPLLNETPYITTELRPIALYNKIPGDFLTGGGSIRVIAAELRVALTGRLGFIASKDGYADANFDAVLPDDEGFANISVGLKYAVIDRPDLEAILTVGIEYEPPTGDIETAGISLQGHGDGLVDVFVTGARAWGRWGLQGSAGLNLAVDPDEDSSQAHYSLHLDYELAPGFYPLVELNGFTTIDESERTGVDFEGIDIVNFGATRSGTVITAALGARYRFNEHVQIGAGYERPVTDREDIMDWRIYLDLVLSF